MPDLGLHAIGAGLHPGLDVVFVHGLGGSSAETWKSNGTDWPSLVAANRTDVAVWVLDYPAEATKWTIKGDGLDLRELGKDAVDYVTALGIGERPIVFVAHSLGGLLVKQMLRVAKEMNIPQYQPIWERTRAVAFLATPHAGSSLANLGKVIKLARLTDTTLDLEANSTHLQELGDWYRQNAPRKGLVTKAYAEGRKTRGVMVVEQMSADPGVLDCLLVTTSEDHLSICKPDGTDSQVYVGVNGLLEQVMKGLQNAVGDAERVTSHLQSTVAAIDRYAPKLLATAQGDAARELNGALEEVGKTYDAVSAAAKKWIQSAVSPSGDLDGQLLASLVTGGLGTEIHVGRGRCHKIDDLYESSIRELIDTTNIPSDGKKELHEGFGRLAEADLDLFRCFENAGDFMEREAREIGCLVTNGQRDEAAERLRATYPNVVHLQNMVEEARRSLSDLQIKVT